MRDDFAALILTHGRPDRVFTMRALDTHGYTGKVFLVVDDEDKAAPEYRERFGDRVVMFSKADVEKQIDAGDNFPGRRGVLYARNASFALARALGLRYFIQLDDDYSGFYYRFNSKGHYGVFKLEPLDWLFERLCEFLEATPFASVAISQGGDHIGGGEAKTVIGSKRKAMNSFVCSVDRPFEFPGRINEDTTAYTLLQRRGVPFLSFMAAQVNQRATQSNAGGLTELYLDAGTYVKSFYSVMFCPSAVRVSSLGDPRVAGTGYQRIHHTVNWDACAPMILSEALRKA